jgi:hypothetical protein
MHAQRGQALVETAIFLPIALVLMFAVLYFARFGVLEERAQSAVRYGATVSYDGSATYSAAQLYSTIAANAAPSGLCPVAVATDTVSTFNGSRSGTAAQGFWKTDSVPAATCTVTTTGFAASATDAFRYLSITNHKLTGTLTLPAYLNGMLNANGAVSASLGYVHTASPALIMYCTSHVGASVTAALGGTYTAKGNC